MRERFKIIWLVTLCCFLASCATYLPASFPGTIDPVEGNEESGGEPVEPGDRVRISLKDGETISGDYVSHDSSTLIIDDVTHGTPSDEAFAVDSGQWQIPLSDIEKVERFDPRTGESIAAAVVVIGAISFAAVAISMSDFMEGWGEQ